MEYSALKCKTFQLNCYLCTLQWVLVKQTHRNVSLPNCLCFADSTQYCANISDVIYARRTEGNKPIEGGSNLRLLYGRVLFWTINSFIVQPTLSYSIFSISIQSEKTIIEVGELRRVECSFKNNHSDRYLIIQSELFPNKKKILETLFRREKLL